MNQNAQSNYTSSGDSYQTRWLKTLRPLEDTHALPRARLEAYFEILDFACELPVLPQPAVPTDAEREDEFQRYAQSLFRSVLQGVGLQGARMESLASMMLDVGLAATGKSSPETPHNQLRAHLVRLKQDVLVST